MHPTRVHLKSTTRTFVGIGRASSNCLKNGHADAGGDASSAISQRERARVRKKIRKRSWAGQGRAWRGVDGQLVAASAPRSVRAAVTTVHGRQERPGGRARGCPRMRSTHLLCIVPVRS